MSDFSAELEVNSSGNLLGLTIGVVVVAYDSADVISECLESLFDSCDVNVRVVVVDNSSGDDTADCVRSWASGATPFTRPVGSPLPPRCVVPKPINFAEGTTSAPPTDFSALTLLRSPVNGGYAHACNRGLELLYQDSSIGVFWIINPDCAVLCETARAILEFGQDGAFGMIGGRTIYYDRPHEIQTDGGRVSRWTGVCRSVNAGCDPTTTPMPEAGSLDFITGAHVAVSRRFFETVGGMAEDYFLYYEEVDWALKRGELPLRITPDAVVYHRGGTVIGSGSTNRQSSPFANYFNYRNRRRFVARHFPGNSIVCLAYSIAKSLQLRLQGASAEAEAVFLGALDREPPAKVRARIGDPASQALAFGRRP